MTADETKDVNYVLHQLLLGAIPDEYRMHIIADVLSDVCDDISDTADEEFSAGDVSLALGRVLMSRLGIEV